jgi:Flp pilus assembly protein TadD
MQEAEQLLQKLVKSNPSIAMARLDLGIVYAEEGRNAAALSELKAAEALKPNDINVHWRLGKLYKTMGNRAEAKVEIDKAQSINKAADNALLDVINKDPSSGKSSSANRPEK